MTVVWPCLPAIRWRCSTLRWIQRASSVRNSASGMAVMVNPRARSIFSAQDTKAADPSRISAARATRRYSSGPNQK